MKCISLWQPYASAVAFGLKRIETRSWHPPRSLIGKKIAIHAAKRWTGEEQYVYRELWPKLPYFNRHSHTGGPGKPLPLGCVVAVACLAAVNRTEDLTNVSPTEQAWGNFGPGRFGWILTNVDMLDVPVPVRGRQGIFEVELPK